MKDIKKDVLDTFLRMVQVDSESFNEKAMVDFLQEEIALRKWDCKTIVQPVSISNLSKDLHLPFTKEEIDKQTCQLAVVIEGNDDTKEPIYLCAHIDTVAPGKGIKPIVEDGVIKTDGTTILGSDDKSGVASIVCAVDQVLKNNIPHGKLVLLFVALEEKGHIGALHANVKDFGVNYGYVFDTGNDIGRLVKRDQHGRTLRLTIKAKHLQNHAMSCLDNNSLTATVDLMAQFPKKVYDMEDITFCQITRLDNTYEPGYMVPRQTDVRYTMRSFDLDKLDAICKKVCDLLDNFKMDNIEISYTISPQLTYGYDMTKMPRGQELMDKAVECIHEMGLTEEYITTGLGGHDSSVFIREGVPSLVLASGMRNIHTCQEYILVKDLENCAILTQKLIQKA